MDEDHAAAAKAGVTHTGEDKTDLLLNPSIGDGVGKAVEGCLKVGEASSIAETVEEASSIAETSPSNRFPQGGLIPGSSTSSFPSSNTLKMQSGSRRVAFVSVKNPIASTSNVKEINFKETESKSDNKQDQFLSILNVGNTKDSLF